ncbi:MAG: radical SAM protein, partial [Armatimonadetes bacterium]|nr:radical SAM protein [Armatimonadota bacterium]
MSLRPRDYLIEEYTRTVCPLCFTERQRRSDEGEVLKDGMLVTYGGSVWLRRFCREHGETESLYEEDAEIWKARHGWSTPTLHVTPDRPGNFASFPEAYRHGLPASHGQHTCILLLNVTDRCNYGCGTCYASSQSPDSSQSGNQRPSIAEILHTVQTVILREGGKLGVLMLSGGEPTVRDDLPELLHRLLDLSITRIMINTNGRRIAKDDRFREFLAKHRDRIEVYLQFDGLRPSTYLALRNEDVAEEKLSAIQRLNESGIFTTLVMMVQRGVNEDEIGDVVRLGLETPRCAGLAVQPMFAAGRVPAFDPLNRTTPTGVLRRLKEQTNGVLDSTDFIPLPCSYRDCCDITYLLKTADDEWKSIPKLIGKEELRRWVHLVSNTITFDTLREPAAAMLKSGALQRVLSEQLKIGTPELMLDLARMCDCIPGMSKVLGGIWKLVGRQQSALERAAERTFRMTVKMFMDAHTFHESRVRQCCVHTGTFEE